MEHKEVIIVDTLPPIWEKAHQIFEIDDQRTIYTYGDKIHNPAHLELSREVVEHEKVHMEQQEHYGGADKWWDQYLADPIFRFHQEVEAYAVQYACFCSINRDRNAQARYLWQLASYLASPMYKIGKTHTECRQAIMEMVK